MRNLHIMNTSYSERFLDGPDGVHYREVLLYLDSLWKGASNHTDCSVAFEKKNGLKYSVNNC
jgi:hypothetical protein